MQYHWIEIIEAGALLTLGGGLLIAGLWTSWHSTGYALRAYRVRRNKREQTKHMR